MKRFHHPFFALLLSLLLLGSQQAAFAHLLSHLHGGSGSVTQYQSEHGALDQLAESCTTCIAFAGVGGGAAPAALPIGFDSLAGNCYCLPLEASFIARLILTGLARAPPPLL